MVSLIETTFYLIVAACALELLIRTLRELKRDYREWRREENHRCK